MSNEDRGCLSYDRYYMSIGRTEMARRVNDGLLAAHER